MKRTLLVAMAVVVAAALAVTAAWARGDGAQHATATLVDPARQPCAPVVMPRTPPAR